LLLVVSPVVTWAFLDPGQILSLVLVGSAAGALIRIAFEHSVGADPFILATLVVPLEPWNTPGSIPHNQFHALIAACGPGWRVDHTDHIVRSSEV
jgi:hypothetical protein